MARSMWLPTGAHSSLNIEHHASPGTGPYAPGAGRKLVWHITVSPWFAIDPMISVLKAKHAEPQLAIGGRPGYKFPVVAQFLPLDQWGKALVHPSGTAETNKAGCVQVEVCATVGNAQRPVDGDTGTGLFHLPEVELPTDVIRAAAKAANGSDEHRAAVLEDIHLCMEGTDAAARAFHSGVAAWTDDTYKALANLTALVDQRIPIPRRRARSFHNQKRFTGAGWVTTKGHLGHMHCPGNSHYDPTTAFRGAHLLRFRKTAPHKL